MTSPLITLHAYLPDKQPFTLDYESIFAVTTTKKQTNTGTKKSATIVYLLSMDSFIEVAESRSEVIELWEEKINEFAESNVELTDDEVDNEDDDKPTKQEDTNGKENRKSDGD